MPSKSKPKRSKGKTFKSKPTTIIKDAIREESAKSKLRTTSENSPDSDWAHLANQVVGAERKVSQPRNFAAEYGKPPPGTKRINIILDVSKDAVVYINGKLVT